LRKAIVTSSGVKVGIRTKRVRRSPLISDKPVSSLPSVPTAIHTKQLFEKGNEAVYHLKYKQEVTGIR
jgi:hypothetical protein